jgi:UPF0755 protein
MAFILIGQIFADNTKFEEKEVYIYIPTDANFDVKKIVAPIFCKWIVLKR